MTKREDIIIYAQIDWRVRYEPSPDQWVIEHKTSAKAKHTSWMGKSWCQTRDALVRCWKELTGEDAPDYLTTLPDRARFM